MAITKPSASILRLLLTIKPNAKTTSVVSVDPATSITLRIHAPPRDGEANEEALGLRKSDAQIIRGGKGREKVVELSGAGHISVEEAVRRLEGLVEE
ncbi:Similar to UPF0235 protein; acc. no. Q54UW1 [Pyronema omphalodes CBS 100304]|uniref:Similar to UPF0235 protein acc. no. Q54UW1 n=1 Tax=Pyronema omphalodes (strain CBS 100304) TaxID=1076935 RepID=U4LUB0_PYROM|nr:Similar to UPF0235 protein; acc. no. Q54UW1 [Pyronema omphalodes CBS 100304]